MEQQKKKYYFLGIGGIGMSAIARYLNMKGNIVCGYDRTPSELTLKLEREGIVINYEDKAENVPLDADFVIYTPAIPLNSKQMQKVISENLPLEKRSVALGHIVKDKKVLAVAGSHGKTTTCGMIAHILSSSPVSCSAFLGGILKSVENNFVYSDCSPYVVVEADEYDRSFLQLQPYASVVTAIDADHLDIYHTYQNLYNAFVDFALLTKDDGVLFAKNSLTEFKTSIGEAKTIETYSLLDSNSDLYASNIRVKEGKYLFDYYTESSVWKDIEMNYPGRHNIENAVVAMGVCVFVLRKEGYKEQEIESIIREGIKSFSGMKRRLDYIIKTEKRVFIDDYAHHPQEIAATITSLREMYPNKQIVGVFQPHLYSRTRDLVDDFAKALDLLDTTILLPIYPARELPIEGVDSSIILKKMSSTSKYYVAKEELYPLLKQIKPELLVSFGAGDIDRMLPNIKQTLESI